MKEEINVQTWIEKFNAGEFDDADVKVQCRAGWYDWFCRETSLKSKTKKMGNIIKKINNSDILENHYVVFKNNCPMQGPLYDSLKFCDLEKGNVKFCVNTDEPYEDEKYVVYGPMNGFKSPVFSTNSSRELVKWFNVTLPETYKVRYLLR